MREIRRWMTLLETAFLDDDPAMVVRYLEHWDRRDEIGDGADVQPLTADEIATVQQTFKRLIHNDHVLLYRSMIFNSLNLSRLAAGDGIGQSWSFTEETAVPYNAASMRIRPVVFIGLVTPAAVDWLTSIALAHSGENEIRLKYGAPVVLQAIKDGHGNNIRTDLYGDTFYASPAV